MPASDKQNLNPAEQVAYLRDEKGISFELVPEACAEWILAHGSYFYRLKSYAKVFDKYQGAGSRKGRYVGADFGHLVELDSLDARLRSLVLMLTLEVEESLKVRINRAAMENGADPCGLTESYMAAEHDRIFSDQVAKYRHELAEEKVAEAVRVLSAADLSDPKAAMAAVNEAMAALGEVAAKRDPDHVANSIAWMTDSYYSGGIIRHYREGLPYWCLLELVTLGTVAGFYKQCFKKGGLLASDEEQGLCREYKSLLRQTQSMRNAAAHSDATLNTLADYHTSSYLKGTRKKLRERGIEGAWVDNVASVPVAMELAAVLMCHEAFVEDRDSREAAAGELRETAERFGKNREWFSKCYPAASFIEYVVRLFEEFAVRY